MLPFAALYAWLLTALLCIHWCDSTKGFPVLYITWDVQVNWLVLPPCTVTIQLGKEEPVSCEIHLLCWLAGPWSGRNPNPGQVSKSQKKTRLLWTWLGGHDRHLTMKIKGFLGNMVILVPSYSMCLLWWGPYCFMFSIYTMATMVSVLISHQ